MRIFLLNVLAAVCYTLSFATDKIQVSPAPQWLLPVKADFNKLPVSRNVSNGYFLELIDQQVHLGNNTRYVHFIRNIINETGVQNASEVSVSFAPQYQNVIFHTINLIRAGKLISKLKLSEIRVVQEETDASDFQYNGLKRAFVNLTEVQKNDRIEVAYSIIGFNPVFKNSYSDKVYFCSSTAITNYFEGIIVPQGRELNVKCFNHASDPSVENNGNETIYRWSNPSTQVWESQPGVPGWFESYPYALITEYASWADVVNWGTSILNNYQHPLSKKLKAKIAEWRKIARGDKDQFAVLALRYVQDHIRYLGLEMGMNTHQPHSPAEVFDHGYGDCKDKSLLLVTILREEGIPAYVALLNTTKKQTMAETAPSTAEFDHAIVAIERSSGYIYADPTETYQRGELINVYIPDYRYALVLRDGETRLQPMEPDVFNVTVINETLDARSTDTIRLNVTTTYKGGKADAIRNSLSATSIIELEENYLQYYAKMFDGIQHAAPVTSIDDSLKNELTVNESYNIPQLMSVNAEGKKAFEIFAKAIYEELPDPASVFRNGPIALNYPSTIYYTLTITLPELWNFPSDKLHITNNSYEFDYSPTVSGRLVTLKYTFKALKDNIPAEEIAQYKTDYSRMTDKLSFEFSYRDNNSPSNIPIGGSINWNLMWIAFVMLLILSLVFRYLNNLTVDAPYTEVPSWPIGSWLILLGVSLAGTAIFRIVSLFTNSYFDRAAWDILGESGGLALQSVLLIDLTLDLLWLAGALACFYWFILRRDIFPRMFIGYVSSILLGQIMLLTLYSILKVPASAGYLRSDVIADLVRSCIYAMIWVTYILRSERVKNTFIKAA